MNLHRRPRQSGFSLLELLIVAVIIVVVAAIATPNIMTAIAASRLRSAANSVSGVAQDGRIRAVRDNRFYTVRSVTENGRVVVFVDANRNGTLDANERTLVAQLPVNMTLVQSGGPSVAGILPSPTAGLPSFNARGLPCTVSGTVCNTNASGFVVYVQQTRALGQTGWGAITVTPTGRVRAWTWSGTSWN